MKMTLDPEIYYHRTRTTMRPEDWMEFAATVMLRADEFTFDDVRTGNAKTSKAVWLRFKSMENRHGTLRTTRVASRRNHPATWSLNRRGCVVMAAIAAGRAVPPAPVEREPELPPVEAAYRRLRAEMNLPEPLPDYSSTVSLANAMSR